MAVQFADFTPDEKQTVLAIVERAVATFGEHGVTIDRVDLMMDLSATHATCPLQLANLLEANDFNFGHDIAGIRRHLDRKTGHLKNCFVPRFAAPEASHVDTNV